MGQPLDSPPARVLFVDHADFIGGAERSLIELVRALDHTQFEPLVACPPGALQDEIRALGARVTELTLPRVRGWRSLPLAPIRLARGVGELRALIRREQVGIVHSNTMRATVFAAPACAGSRARFVWHVRDLHREKLYLTIMARRSNAIIVNSRAVQRTIPAWAQRNTTLIYNGVPLADFDPAQWDGPSFRAEFDIAPDAPVIGNFGWIAPWKGQRYFIEAASLISQQCPAARFMIIGDVADARYRDYERSMRALSRDALGDRLVWTGARAAVQPALAALDLLLHCADNEPFGRALIEAMALRVPVVAFRGGGPDEIIVDTETGYLVAPRDVAGMAEHSVRLLNQPALRRAMGAAARQHVIVKFDSLQSARKVEAVYRGLLSQT